MYLMLDKVNNMAAKTRKDMGLKIINSQNLYNMIWWSFLHDLTPFEHICISFLVF